MTIYQYPAYNLQQTFRRLPARAKHKYRALKQLADDAGALQRSAHNRITLLESEISDLIIRLRTVDSRETDTIADINTEIETLRADIARLDQERAKREAARANAEQVLAYLNSFITSELELDRAGAANTHFNPVVVDLEPSDREDPRSALLTVRNEIAAAKSEIIALRAAPLPTDEIRARLTADIDRLAAAGRPQLDLANGQVRLTFADDNRYAPSASALFAPTGSASRMLCWLFRDELVSRVTAGLDDVAGVSLIERDRRTSELQARLALLEHREEALVVCCLDRDMEVHRRPGASGWALLDLTVEYATEMESEPLPKAAAE